MIIFTTAAVLYGKLTNSQSALNCYNVSINVCFFPCHMHKDISVYLSANVFQQLQGFCENYRLYFHIYVSSLKDSLIDLLLKSHIASGDLPMSMMQVGHQILLEQQ